MRNKFISAFLRGPLLRVKYLVSVDTHDPDATEEAKRSQSWESLEKTKQKIFELCIESLISFHVLEAYKRQLHECYMFVLVQNYNTVIFP